MKEFVDGFRIDIEELYKEMYDKLDILIDTAMFNMSFVDDDPDNNYALLQEVLVDFIQEQIGSQLYNCEESN
jgi:hypothetical protein